MGAVFTLIGFIISLIFAFVPGLIEKPAPPGYVLHPYKSTLDLASGISKWEYIRRKNRGDYWVTQEEFREIIKTQRPNEVLPGIVDIDRYNYDKTRIPPVSLEWRVKIGKYRFIEKDKSNWDRI